MPNMIAVIARPRLPSNTSIVKRAIPLAFGLIVVALGPFTLVANATETHARKERKPCGYCHVAAKGGGELGFRGLYHTWKGHSLAGFDEERQAALAGVKPGAMGKASRPTKPYPPKK